MPGLTTYSTGIGLYVHEAFSILILNTEKTASDLEDTSETFACVG